MYVIKYYLPNCDVREYVKVHRHARTDGTCELGAQLVAPFEQAEKFPSITTAQWFLDACLSGAKHLMGKFYIVPVREVRVYQESGEGGSYVPQSRTPASA